MRDPATSRTLKFEYSSRAGNIGDGLRGVGDGSVHPRVGGEHVEGYLRWMEQDGSSPRGRGTLLDFPAAAFLGRFIPAWAGNILPRFRRWQPRSVHPRVGGEHIPRDTSRSLRAGSSPRGRGTLPQRSFERVLSRFIPAWAGNMPRGHWSDSPPSVHPRVGGEHLSPSSRPMTCTGSSPRGRGTWWLDGGVVAPDRFIPAWAGNMPRHSPASARSPVHPRVGGEHVDGEVPEVCSAGSSPRGRGTCAVVKEAPPPFRFIPAWAGNIAHDQGGHCCGAVHPRVGGEHLASCAVLRISRGSSPRGRGTSCHLSFPLISIRFIPAWAGNMLTRPDGLPAASVHPRVGGEHFGGVHSGHQSAGSSPRGRGTCTYAHAGDL